MKKFFAFAGLTVLSGAFAASAMAGCSSSDDGNGGTDDTTGDASGDERVRPDNDAGPPSCIDETVASQLGGGTSFTSNFAGGYCTDAQVDAIVDNCFGSGGEEGACTAALEVKTCGDCMFGGGTGSSHTDYPVFAVLNDQGQGLITGIYACLGLEINRLDCVKPALDQVLCQALACQECAEGAEADACETAAFSAGCENIPVPDGCKEAFDGITDAQTAKCIVASDGVGTIKLSGKRVCVAGTGTGGTTDAGTDAGQDAQ